MDKIISGSLTVTKRPKEIHFDFDAYSEWIPTKEELIQLKEMIEEALKPAPPRYYAKREHN